MYTGVTNAPEVKRVQRFFSSQKLNKIHRHRRRCCDVRAGKGDVQTAHSDKGSGLF